MHSDALHIADTESESTFDDALARVLLSGIDFIARVEALDSDQSRVTVETAAGRLGTALLGLDEGDQIDANLTQISSEPTAEHLKVVHPATIADDRDIQKKDQYSDVTIEAHSELIDLVATLLYCGWTIDVHHQSQPAPRREAAITVVATLPANAATERLSTAFEAEVTGVQLIWNLRPVDDHDGHTVAEWHFDNTGTGVRTCTGFTPLTAIALLGVALAVAPSELLDDEIDVPIGRHSADGSMPASELPTIPTKHEDATPAQVTQRREAIAKWARDNNFGRAIAPQPKLVADELTAVGNGSAGYYLLEFSDGQCYVGQSISIDKRLGQHRLIHKDIANIRLQPDPAASRLTMRLPHLLKHERVLIRDAQRTGLTPHMRNRAEMTIIPGNAQQLDRKLLDQEKRAAWMTDPLTTNVEDLRGTSPFTFEQRRGGDHQDRCGATLSRAGRNASTMIGCLNSYLRRCVPLPLSTEYEYWTLSTPNGNYSRLSIGFTEALALFFPKDGSFGAYFQVNGTELLGPNDVDDSRLFAFVRNHPGVDISPVDYKDAGPDNLFLTAKSIDALAELLDDTAVTRAAATAALNLMRVRKSGKKRKESHNFALAALALGLDSAIPQIPLGPNNSD